MAFKVFLGINIIVDSLEPMCPFHVDNTIKKLPVDFEDALLYEIAQHHQLDYFITSNIKGFRQV